MPKKLILSITERIEDAKPSKMVEELNFKIHRKAQEIDQEIIESTYAGLIEENKKLRAYADNLDSENDNQAIEIEELKKENRNLKMSLEEKDENCYSLARENEQLKLHIEAKDKAYMNLLTDYNYLQDMQ